MRYVVDKLLEAGLTALQSRVYTSIVELGTGTAAEIATRSKINRVTSYTALKELEEMGLISVDEKDAVKIYQISEFDNLSIEFMKRAKKAIKAYRIIKSLVPDLKKLNYHKSSDPNINYYEGNNAVEFIINKLAKEPIEMLYISAQEHYNLLKPILNKSIGEDARPRVIIPNSIKAEMLVYLDHRVVPAKIAHFPASMIIFKDKYITFYSDNDFPQAYMTEDERLTEQQRSIFELNWRILSGEHIIVPKIQ